MYGRMFIKDGKIDGECLGYINGSRKIVNGMTIERNEWMLVKRSKDTMSKTASGQLMRVRYIKRNIKNNWMECEWDT